MDKLHIVFYVGTRDETFDLTQIKEHIGRITNSNTVYYVVPDHYSDRIRVEAINPRLLEGDQYEEISDKIRSLENKMCEFKIKKND